MASQPLTILCFGDSLTEGYSQYGLKMTPYAQTMKEFLEEQLGDTGTDIQVCVEGVSGQLVTNGMVARMEKLYEHTNANDLPFNWLIFLAGTNDLGWGKSVDDIWDAIVKVTDIPRVRDGAKILMCTIPECRVKSEKSNRRRGDLNERIKSDERSGVYVFDLHQKIPYHAMESGEREVIWDDGLHLTEEGYDRFGLMVGRRLLGIIERGEGRIEGEAEAKVETKVEEDPKAA